MLKTSKLRVTVLCTPTRQPKKHHDDPMPYFPLYALPVDLGSKSFAAVLVLQHVENNFIDELYETREKYTVKCIHIANSKSGLHMVENDPREETKHRSTSFATKKNVSISKHNDKNANGKISDVKNAARNRSLSGDRELPESRGVDTGRTRASRGEELAGSRNVRVNKDGTLTTCIDASRHDGTLPPQDLRNVLQSRHGHNHDADFLDKLISPSDIQDLRTVLRGKRMYAERDMDVVDDFREERFVDEIIHDRNRNLLDSSFVHGVVPPGTEDLRQVLQEKKVMVENITGDRNERCGEFYSRGQVKVYENNDLRSFIEENRATHKNEGKYSFREFSRLSYNTETRDGEHTSMSFRDELSSGNNLHPSDVWGKLHSRNNRSEAFPLLKDSALLERGLDSKINIRDERRKVMFADIQDISSDADLLGSGPGRSFDDSELGRKKPRTAGGWKARDDTHNVESIHDSFSKFDAYLSNVKSNMKDFQHSWKAKPEFHQYFPNAGMKSELRALSPNLKLQVMGDVRREIPYRDDKPHYFSEGDKRIKAEQFAFDERRTEVGIAERNSITFGSEDNRMFGETDRNRTHIDGNERNGMVGESVSERRSFVGPERTGASVNGPDDRNKNMFVRAEDRKRQVFETEDRKKQVFNEPNRNSVMFGGSEDRKRPLHDDVEDRNRSVYGQLEDRKRQMYGEPVDTKMQVYDEPIDRKRQVYVEIDVRQRSLYAELEDRKKLMYGEPGDKRSVYVKPEDLKRLPYGEPEDRTKSLHGEPVDSKRLKYGDLEDKRSVYEELGDRKRSVYGGPEDESGYTFSKTDDRNLPVTERSRPVVKVGQNRPTVKEIERNRLMAGEREREKVLFGGRTDIYTTGYYAADSKVDSKVEDGDKEASKRHYHHHQQQQHSPPCPPPPLLTGEQMVKVQSTKEKRRQHTVELEKAQKIVALNAREVQQGVSIPDKQAGGNSVAKLKDGKTYVKESSVKINDGKNLNVGDRLLKKCPQAYWAIDRGHELAATHHTPSSWNRDWDKEQSSGGHSSAASWTSSWGQEGRQRDTQEQHGTVRSLQPIDVKWLPPLSNQHVGKYGTSDEPGRSPQPSVSTFGQSPQNYRHSYQQYGVSVSIPAQPLTVGTGNMSQYGTWQGGGRGGWNTLSGRSTTGGLSTPGAWNTSNNWSSQSGNAGYTWR
ncbi:hypothetical protein PR048_004107 [Dryococelus australis]|uniref:Uncharacterized protein n=1 Tax=Dryococelus australis TaxID=614101 RepID=A0ABQ9I5Q0_9NEOP|nr:hypothetical protein PR048_004107 [Dryococelus australis]